MEFEIVYAPEDAPEDNNYPWLQVNYERIADCDTVTLYIDDVEITNIVWVDDEGNPIDTPTPIPAKEAFFQLSFADGDITPGEHKFTITATAGNLTDKIEMVYDVPVLLI